MSTYKRKWSSEPEKCSKCGTGADHDALYEAQDSERLMCGMCLVRENHELRTRLKAIVRAALEEGGEA